MFSTFRSLVIGLGAAVLFGAVISQLLAFDQQLPGSETLAFATEGSDVDVDSCNLGTTMAQSLKNPVRFVQRAFCRGAMVYKSSTGTPSFMPINNLLSTSAFASLLTNRRSFSTTARAMASTKTFFEATKERRTLYALTKEIPISDKRIVELVESAATYVPSSFNSQTTRLVVLLHGEHESFWDQTREVLKPIVPEAQWASYTGPKTQGFKDAYGTILFFEDPVPVEALKKQYVALAHHFESWSEHTSAMHQYYLWTALTAEGLGANLQHYNPIIDEKIQTHWKIPREWRLRAQLVIGGKGGEPNANKEVKPLETRVFVHGAKE